MNEGRLAAGIMSGTSLDGIDVAIATISGVGSEIKIEMICGKTYPYPEHILNQVKKAIQNELNVREISNLNFELGRLYGEVVLALCKEEGITPSSLSFVASHGQTVYHQGASDKDFYPSTLQLGAGAIIAQMVGTDVVYDFRVADMAAGGQGAPLVPFVDYILFANQNKNRIIQNIGGISNITVLPKGFDTKKVFAFDTGPGNMMINRAMEVLFSKPYDDGGKIAASGKLIEELKNEIMAHPYLTKLPPKSAGREQFGVEYTDQLLNKYKFYSKEDLVHTITYTSALTMADAIKRFSKLDSIDELIVSGGGAKNTYLLKVLQTKLFPTKILTSDALNLSSDFKEALAFIVIGNQTLNKEISTIPTTTGATKAVISGSVVYYK